ncbi:HelD family protein [Paenibacillus senegalensis]|uniref:HelD family protein n=1 Tax=Paenibacillus senegalensis TaxID=1465766 RepID=UPI000289A77C|nr:3'-5' exonuclease [Paenibacillus senegalensis]
MEASRQSAYQEELNHLKLTVERLQTQLQELEAIPIYHGYDLAEQSLEAMRQARRERLSKSLIEPYFGRLDFEASGEQRQALYLGKHGAENEETGELLVIDWRAPVASLFYSFTGGEETAVYDSPDGEVSGTVYLKRNLVIRQQELQRVVDTYVKGSDQLPVADEFLLYRLGENKDNRLRDIVSTIQSEQDRIIRAAKNSALVIQGVAGSGKTTVALHRLAFLLYQYREQVRAEKMIIFAPNRMFLDYISGVLPELGVGDIQQTTFTDWALDLLEHDVKPAPQETTYSYWFGSGAKQAAMDAEVPGRYKGSTAFMSLLDELLTYYEDHHLPENDFEPYEDAVLSAETIHQWYKVDNRHYPLAKRREKTLARIKRWLEMQLDTIADPKRKKEQRKAAMSRLRTYQKGWLDPSPLQFYTQLFMPAKRTLPLPEQLLAQIPAAIQEESARRLKKKEVLWEDLAPLVHIRNRFNGMDRSMMFDHVVIDEAQDFSPFQISLLKQYTPSGSFTILGDLSQGIHAYQGITSWDEFLHEFDPEKSAYFQLERSYRSTMEIIYFANSILKASGIPFLEAVPVFRSGDKVKQLPLPPGQTGQALPNILAQLESNHTLQTIAVLTRDDKRSREIHRMLAEAGIEAALLHAGLNEYEGGLSVLPVYLAKGLEFDAAIIVDVDDNRYTANALDAKLLYVGATRALHALWVVYEGVPSPLLSKAEESFFITENITG